MSEDKTTAKAEDKTKTSGSPDEQEPKQASAKPAGAKPAKAIARNAVVSSGDTDPVLYSKAKVPGRTEGRKSLTVLHIQRRLMDEGYPEAASAPGGRYEELTTRAVAAYQRDRAEEPTGILTRAQFADLFEGDPNVTVTIDTVGDHV